LHLPLLLDSIDNPICEPVQQNESPSSFSRVVDAEDVVRQRPAPHVFELFAHLSTFRNERRNLSVGRISNPACQSFNGSFQFRCAI
jgi:hypothetical protein